MEPRESQEPVIQVQGLTKRFGNRLALRGVDLEVRRGGFLSVLGPNGAGKTTLIKILGTLSKPSSGMVRVGGLEVGRDAVAIRRYIGVVSHQTFLYDALTAYENLKFYGRMFGVADLEERIGEVIAKVGLEPYLHNQVRTLSRGLQQRLSIARVVIHNPPILLLDEPDTGLDQHAGRMLGEMLNSFTEEGGTVVMTTHRLERGLEMGDQVVILSEGKVVYEESKALIDVTTFEGTYYHYTGARP